MKSSFMHSFLYLFFAFGDSKINAIPRSFCIKQRFWIKQRFCIRQRFCIKQRFCINVFLGNMNLYMYTIRPGGAYTKSYSNYLLKSMSFCSYFDVMSDDICLIKWVMKSMDNSIYWINQLCL